MAQTREELTAFIRSMYEVYPFPNLEYQRLQGVQLAVYFAKQAKPGSRSLLAEGVTFMDAGCGTGSTVLPLAKAYPESQFLAVDMTPTSLEIAERDAKKLGLTNIKFQQADIQTLNLGKTFDVVINFGVLSILADRAAGLGCLAKHVAPTGRIIIWAYGTHGRYRLQLNQKMLALLTQNTTDWRERLAIGKAAIRSLPRQHVECYFSVPTHALEGKYQEGFDWILTNDSWFADQYIHPIEVSFQMSEFLDLFDKVGLRFDHWIGADMNIAKYTEDADTQKRVRALSDRDRLLFFDMLLKPVDYFLVARQAAFSK